jgi:hypothetical protein
MPKARNAAKALPKTHLPPSRTLDVREKEASDHWDNAEVFLNFVIFQEFDYAARRKILIHAWRRSWCWDAR